MAPPGCCTVARLVHPDAHPVRRATLSASVTGDRWLPVRQCGGVVVVVGGGGGGRAVGRCASLSASWSLCTLGGYRYGKPVNAEWAQLRCAPAPAMRTCAVRRGECVPPEPKRLVADGQRENSCGHSCDDGDCRRECNADPHGTSLRRARGGARLCSVGAGSGHCIRAPNGEREGVVRSGMCAAGCAAGCVKARGLSSVCPRFVVFRPVQVDGHAETPTGLR